MMHKYCIVDVNNLKPIGGFFELELPQTNANYHQNALALTNGRACISWILKKEQPKSIYVPFYTCYALFEPMEKLGINVIFYSINEFLEPIDLPELQNDELFIYINYFGLKNNICKKLIKKYNKQVIIDDTHNFFHFGYGDIYSFTSARKYFGVADGAYLYGCNTENIENIERNKNISILHNIKRLEEEYDLAYEYYLQAESKFDSKIQRISLLSEKILNSIEYDIVIQKRIENYKYLHKNLSIYNSLGLDLENIEVPFCYPFLPAKLIEKAFFHAEKVFIPILWPDILERGNENFKFENEFVQKLLPLPIDHRYNTDDMKRIINLIEGKINE